MTSHRIGAFAVLLTAAAPLAAQGLGAQEYRGVFAEYHTSMVIEDGVAGSSPIHAKAHGVEDAILSLFPGYGDPNIPDYRTGTIEPVVFAAIGVSTGYLDIKGISTGNDLLPVEHDPALSNGSGGFRFVGGNRWATLMVGVEETAQGASGYLATRAPAAGFEILGYYTDNNTLPGGVAGGTLLELSIDDVDPTTVPASAGSTPALAAFDLFMPALVQSGGTAQPPFMPVAGELYFTISQDCANALGASWQGQPITGASIMFLRWSNGSWGGFDVVADAADLGLLPTDDVDALAVGPIPSGISTNVRNRTILFSHVGTGDGRPQLMVAADVDEGGGTPVRRSGPLFRANGSQTVPEAMGLTLTSDIKITCSADPETGTTSTTFAVPYTNPNWTPSKGCYLSISRPSPRQLRCLHSGLGRAVGAKYTFIAFTGTGQASGPFDQYYFAPFTRDDTAFNFQFDLFLPAAAMGAEVGIGAYLLNDSYQVLAQSQSMKIRLL